METTLASGQAGKETTAETYLTGSMGNQTYSTSSMGNKTYSTDRMGNKTYLQATNAGTISETQLVVKIVKKIVPMEFCYFCGLSVLVIHSL